MPRVKRRQPLTNVQQAALKRAEDARSALNKAKKELDDAIKAAWLEGIPGSRIQKVAKVGQTKIHWATIGIRRRDLPEREASSGVATPESQKLEIIRLVREGKTPQWQIAETVGCSVYVIQKTWKAEAERWGIKEPPTYGKMKNAKRPYRRKSRS